MNETQVEQVIQDKGLVAPRIAPSEIDKAIVSTEYWQPKGTTLTVCVLVLRNGMTVVGESACVSKENFNIDIGQSIAYSNAREKIWVLEGYLLREKLSKIDNMPGIELAEVKTDGQALNDLDS